MRNLRRNCSSYTLNVLKRLDEAGDTDEVVDVLYYLLNEGKFLDEEHFWSTFDHKFSLEVEGKMSTIAQQMEQRAIEKKNVEIATKLLSEKIGLTDNELIALIKRLTGLPEDKIQELRKKH